jgi:tetratricopeptide (TPR) repeat protein
MKIWLFSSILFVQHISGQTSSTIDAKGDGHIVTVTQGNNNSVTIYNLRSEADCRKYLQYLEKMPGVNKDVKILLSNTTESLKILQKLLDNQTGTEKDVLERLEKYVRDNERLKAENESLREKFSNQDFERVLTKASEYLNQYENEKYQSLLDSFKLIKKRQERELQEQLSSASFLQALNSFNNYLLPKAIAQIEEALSYFPQNEQYCFLKADISFQMYRFDEAIIFYQKVLEHTKDDTIKSAILNNLGLIYTDKQNFQKAITYFINALNINEEIFGLESPNVSMIYNNIGALYEETRDYDKALFYYFKDLNTQEKAYGPNNPSTAISYNNVGLIYYYKQNIDSAFYFLDKSLRIREAYYGTNHPITATLYNNIGMVYAFKKDYLNALKYFAKALTISESAFGMLHPHTAATNKQIGRVYFSLKEYDTALDYYLKSLKVYGVIFGATHPKFIQTAFDLAVTYILKGEKDSAILYLTKINSPNYNIAMTLNKVGTTEFPDKPLFFELSREYLSKNTTDTITNSKIIVLRNLALSYCQVGQNANTKKIYKELSSLFKQTSTIKLTKEQIRNELRNCLKKDEDHK